MIYTTEEISYLAKYFGNASPISPFALWKNNPLNGDEQKSLSEKGVLADENISPDALKLLLPLSLASRCGRVLSVSALAIVEKFVFTDDHQSILIDKMGQRLDISLLKPNDENLLSPFDILNPKDVRAYTNLSLSLPSSDFLLLLLILDLYRRLGLCQALGLTSEFGLPITPSILEKALALNFPNGLYFLTKEAFKTALQPSEIPASLENLVNLNALIKNETAYLLDPVFSDLAGGFSLATQIITFENTQVNGDDLGFSTALVLSCGLIINLLINYDGAVLTLDVISTIEIHDLIKTALSCPVVLPENNNPTPKEPTSPEIVENAWLCACGKKNTTNFCIYCGKSKSENRAADPVNSKETLCIYCGQKISVDAKFCKHCGGQQLS
jgi:hypothetical protein